MAVDGDIFFLEDYPDMRQHESTHLLVTSALIWYREDNNLGWDWMDLSTTAMFYSFGSFLKSGTFIQTYSNLL